VLSDLGRSELVIRGDQIMTTFNSAKLQLMALAALALLMPATAHAQAQRAMTASERAYQSRLQRSALNNQRPTVSPYMNLLRNDDLLGGSNAANYYTLVRPQVRQNTTNARQTEELNELQREVDTRTAAPPAQRRIRRTGHVSRFMDYSGHFGNGGPR
jgi:hypothetical protein